MMNAARSFTVHTFSVHTSSPGLNRASILHLESNQRSI